MRLIACLLMLLAASGCAQAQPPFAKLDGMTGQLDFGTGICSGTQVYGRHAIATTRHCIAHMEGRQIHFQGVMVNVERVIFDRYEGAIIIVNRDLGPHWAKTAKVPAIGAPVWVVGNVLGIKQIYRESMVSWVGYVPALGTTIFFHDCHCWSGDSGAGIFDNKGRLVGIHYGAIVSRWHNGEDMPVEWSYSYAYPLSFTPEQIAEASK